MRIAAGVEYDGSRFSGWQHQTAQRTVQQSLEHALSRVADHPITVTAAGRTDTGVHASGQVIHFDTDSQRTPHQWLRAANTNLPDDVTLLWVNPVSDEFHARFSAVRRAYRYIILNRSVPSALFDTKVCWDYRKLDVAAMRAASVVLRGCKDFTSFRAAGCQAATPIRHVSRLYIGCVANWIWFDIVADAFLQHMVRNIVGTLTAVGAGDKPVGWVGEVLAARDRKLAGATAPPGGLYLSAVSYPGAFKLPDEAAAVRYW